MRRVSEDYIICYFDILGYKNIIARSCIEEKEFIGTIWNITKSIFKIKDDIFPSNVKPQIYCFSDNFVICIKHDKNEDDKLISNLSTLITFIKILQLQMNTFYNVLVRGSIVKGKLYCNKNFIFGEGLVNAYTIENEVAIYPRIIVQKELINEVIEKCRTTRELFELKEINLNEKNVFCWHKNFMLDIWLEENLIDEEEYKERYDEEEGIKVVKDFDGNYYVNFLEAINIYEDEYVEDYSMKYLHRMRYMDTIVFYFRNFSDDLKVIKKLLWCCDYANNFFVNQNEEKMFNKDSILTKAHVNLDKVCKKFMIEYTRQDNTKSEKMHLEHLISIIDGL